MKSILNIILLSPVLVYVVLLLINSELLSEKTTVNLFWLAEVELPLITLISVFFVGYIMILYSLFKFSNFFVAHKNKNLNNEVNELKAEMQDREPKLLEAIEKKFWEILEKSKAENKQNIDILKKENEKVVTNLTYDLKMIKEKIEKIKTDK